MKWKGEWKGTLYREISFQRIKKYVVWLAANREWILFIRVLLLCALFIRKFNICENFIWYNSERLISFLIKIIYMFHIYGENRVKTSLLNIRLIKEKGVKILFDWTDWSL